MPKAGKCLEGLAAQGIQFLNGAFHTVSTVGSLPPGLGIGGRPLRPDRRLQSQLCYSASAFHLPTPSDVMQPLDHLPLNLFIVVCEEGTIARAGERAFMAPSAVSKRISDIEARFGTVFTPKVHEAMCGYWRTGRRSWSSCPKNSRRSCWKTR